MRGGGSKVVWNLSKNSSELVAGRFPKSKVVQFTLLNAIPTVSFKSHLLLTSGFAPFYHKKSSFDAYFAVAYLI